MAEPEDAILPLLRELRSELKDRFDSTNRKFVEQYKRLDAIDRSLDDLRKAFLRRPVLGRYVGPEGDLDAIETRLRTAASFDESIRPIQRRSDLGTA